MLSILHQLRYNCKTGQCGLPNDGLLSTAPGISPFLLTCDYLLGDLPLEFGLFLVILFATLSLTERSQPLTNSTTHLREFPHPKDNQDNRQDESDLPWSHMKWHSSLLEQNAAPMPKRSTVMTSVITSSPTPRGDVTSHLPQIQMCPLPENDITLFPV